MKLREFLALDRPALLKFLTETTGLLPAATTCPICSSPIARNDATLMFRCRKRIAATGRYCTFVRAVRAGTWFAYAKLPLETICRFVAYFVKLNTSPRQLFLQNEFDVSSRTAPKWIARCRRVCLRWCLRASRENATLGGPGRIVEIDEMKLGHRKYHRGRTIEGTWLFGAVERGSGRLFLIPIESREADTLLPIIYRRIARKTLIISDCWKSYWSLGKHPDYRYMRVNHSNCFVCPETGAHTQHIERVWRDVRGALPRFGCSRRNMMEYLGEYMFRREVALPERIEAFFRAAAVVQNDEESDEIALRDAVKEGVFSTPVRNEDCDKRKKQQYQWRPFPRVVSNVSYNGPLVRLVRRRSSSSARTA